MLAITCLSGGGPALQNSHIVWTGVWTKLKLTRHDHTYCAQTTPTEGHGYAHVLTDRSYTFYLFVRFSFKFLYWLTTESINSKMFSNIYSNILLLSISLSLYLSIYPLLHLPIWKPKTLRWIPGRKIWFICFETVIMVVEFIFNVKSFIQRKNGLAWYNFRALGLSNNSNAG